MNAIEKIKSWINHAAKYIFNRILKPYLGPKFAPVEIVVGDTSYTNHSKIVVAISEEEAEELSKDDIMRILTLKCYHEAGHCKYTDSEEYREMVMAMADYFEEEAKKESLNPHYPGLINLSSGLCNAIEDGRMENQVVKDVPGVQKHREWYRLREWLDYSSATADVGDMYEVFNNILTIATMGMYCKDFETTYPTGTKVRDIVDACIEPISGYIKSSTVKKGTPHALEMAKELKDLILDAMKNEKLSNPDEEGPQVIKLPPELEDMLRKAMESQANFSKEDTEETDEDGPVIAILTDDMEESDSDSEGKKPDMIIDLRKNPPKKNQTPPLTEQENDKGDGQGEGSSEEGQDEDNSNTSDGNGQESDSSEPKEGEDGKSDSSKSSEKKDEGESSSKNADNAESKDAKSKSSKAPDSNQDSDSDSSSEVDQESLQAGAKDFEDSIEDRMRKALEKASQGTSSEVSQRVSQANKALETADKVEDGNTKLSSEDIDFLHENGYLSGYYDKVPSTNVLKDNRITPQPIPESIKARGRQIETEIKNIISSQSEPDRDYLFDGDLDEMSIGRFVTFGQGDIFCQEGDPKNPDMCVLVRQDNSGSMSGPKFHEACQAGALIEQAFKNLVPIKMTYFTDDEFNVIKDWGDTETSRNYMTDFDSYFRACGGNDDALAIMSAALELSKRPEAHKVLIVISDGAPCCRIEAVTAAVQWARKNGIFVISFFIGDKDFIESSWELYKTMYEKYFCGVSPEKLGPVLVRFLRTMIESS